MQLEGSISTLTKVSLRIADDPLIVPRKTACPLSGYNFRMIARFALLFVCMMATIHAQEPQVTPEMNVESATLHDWLHSGDLRLVAWAADFARRRHEDRVLRDIPNLLEHWSMPPITGGYEEQAAQRRAVMALLDALIEGNVRVPIPVIKLMAGEFPAQSLLLIQQHVSSEGAKSTLLDWAINDGGGFVDTRSRSAAMILAKSPDSFFVHEVLKGLVQHVTIRVVSPGTGYGSGSGSCGDSGILPPTTGWPVVFTYGLREENGETSTEDFNSLPVVKLGNHRVVAYRYPENRGGGGCISRQSDASFRHELVANWLGIEPSKMKWQPEQSLDVVWVNKTSYQRELGAFLEEDRAKMSETLRGLVKQGLLDEQNLDGAFPQISIRFECHLTPCPLAGL
jgi:hypothetical protein